MIYSSNFISYKPKIDFVYILLQGIQDILINMKSITNKPGIQETHLNEDTLILNLFFHNYNLKVPIEGVEI